MFFGCAYVAIYVLSKKILVKNGAIAAIESNHMMRMIQEGFGSIRDVILDGTTREYVSAFNETNQKYIKAQSTNQIISLLPRNILETLGILLVAFYSYYLSQSSNEFIGVIPVLGVLAFASQKTLPLIQQIFGAWSNITGNKPALKELIEYLNLPKNSEDCYRISFNENIVFERVTFSYEANVKILENLNITIKKGDRIGVIGATGCGKSTFLDLLMGLLNPSAGFLTVDGVPINQLNKSGWMKNIAHVPQEIYLFDSTVLHNIALESAPNLDRVIESAKKANIHDVITNFKGGYSEILGERGARLSGGQKQRIGIARALYKNADLLIFDEATSALDSKIEKNIIEGLNESLKDKTIVMVAHRTEALKYCNKIIKFEGGACKLI